MSQLEGERQVLVSVKCEEYWAARAQENPDEFDAETAPSQRILDEAMSAFAIDLTSIDPSLHISDRGIRSLPGVEVSGSPEGIEKLLTTNLASVEGIMNKPEKISVVTFNA